MISIQQNVHEYSFMYVKSRLTENAAETWYLQLLDQDKSLGL